MRRVVLALAAALLLVALFLLLRPTPPTTGPQARALDLVVSGGQMTPAEISIREGDQVTLQITTDRNISFHLHGYNLEQEIGPGKPATLRFEANLTGRFEIEDEISQQGLGTLVVEPR